MTHLPAGTRLTASKLEGMLVDVDRQVFTAGGTWNKPAGAVLIHVQVQAGGGAGGGAQATGAGESSGGSGGAGGSYSESWLDASTVGASETVTVGSGGLGSSGGNGLTGSDSSFGTHVTATGGVGGTASSTRGGSHQQTGPQGGAAGTGDIVVPASASHPAVCASGSTDHSFRNVGGNGGGSYLGRGGAGTQGGAGGGGHPFGGAGGGASIPQNSSAQAGGDGADGVVIVDTYVEAT